MPHLFISYAKKDTRKLAFSIADKLNEIEDITAWVDRSLKSGRSWERQIETEIRRCDTMIVLYSPDINRHLEGKDDSYVLTEIHYAKYTLKKPIIPIMAQETTPPIALAREHYIDFTIDGLTVDNLVEALCEDLGIEYKNKATKKKEAETPEWVKMWMNATAKQKEKQEKQNAQEESKPVKLIEIVPEAEITKSLKITESEDAIKSIIGEPFEWCEVPAGEFIYSIGKDTQVLSLPAFAIAKYPITYSQFQIFIDEKEGFKNSRWWKGLAVHDRDRSIPSQPILTFRPREIKDTPRNRINWYDAVAFCRWLSWRLGDGYDIDNIAEWAVRLPSEFEWEKAARGTDGRRYPWGNQFDENRANTRSRTEEATVPVTQYPNSASVYGVVDMIGNVWEWCLTSYQNDQKDVKLENIKSSQERVLRGGSVFDHTNPASAINRNIKKPYLRKHFYGFRIMRPS